MSPIQIFTESIERIARFVLPGAYIVLLYFASRTSPGPDATLLQSLVIVFLGPSAYLFYREVMGVIDDIVLNSKAAGDLSGYKARLYKAIQREDKNFQNYIYLKFSGAHHGLMLSLLTLFTTAYVTCVSPRPCFLSNHACVIVGSMAVVFLASAYNYCRLHSIQHVHLMK